MDSRAALIAVYVNQGMNEIAAKLKTARMKKEEIQAELSAIDSLKEDAKFLEEVVDGTAVFVADGKRQV